MPSKILLYIAIMLRRLVARDGPGLDALRDLRLPGGLFAELRCARRIDATARRIAQMGAKIAHLSGRLSAGSIAGAVDADRSLRRMLGDLKADLGDMRRDLAQWHLRECRGRAGARLTAAIDGLNRVAADTQAAAERLVRDIEEYEGTQ